ncbi:threonine dehydratase [Candidatus Laterigemmans baculatus]|uniref:threonine dehydratase n=1 Tax=Candidatus Laterigemmans baculatus TaxID=2770505 RepID=UPI0013D977B1|nr:threonine dehydratase [Candidatus Laterigemmans baculatus]
MELPVRYSDVLDALPRVHALLPQTPLYRWPGLGSLLGFPFYLKHENHQPTGAFKIRGGVNLVGTLGAREREAGILAVSTGNHGQSLAYAAGRAGVACTIVVPRGNNPDKNSAIRALGAELIEAGDDFDEARECVEEIVRQRGGRYVHSANEPLLVAGVGTMAWEIFQTLPAPDVILVPIGLGSGVCGTCIVAKHLRPQTQIIGVQAAGADAVAASWQAKKIVTRPRVDTCAEGIATRVPAEMTLEIMWKLMDDVILVDDQEMRHAVYEILQRTHNLPEAAGAAALAAAYQQRTRFQNQTVVGILSGGNLDMPTLHAILHERQGSR